MGTLSITTFLTLDGVMQAPGGPDEDESGGFRHGGWFVPFFDPDFGGFIDGIFRRPAAFLLGRGTFDIFAGYWPRVTDPDDLVARQLREKTKYVVTSRPGLPAWEGTKVISFADIARVKRETEGELQVHGSAQLAAALLRTDLVDELNLAVAPSIVGGGKHLFSDALPAGLALAEARPTSTGVVLARYRREGAVRAGAVDHENPGSESAQLRSR